MIKLLLVDFDGVMSKSKFYAPHPAEHPKAFDHLITALFMTPGSTLLDDWMRGKIDYRSVHKQIAKAIQFDPTIYDDALLRSITEMHLNHHMLDTVRTMRNKGVKVVLFTNNMDVFDNVTVHHFKLADYFDDIYSSSQHGKLKFEDSTLFEKATSEANAQPHETALVDDSISSITPMKALGGKAFHYKDYTEDHTDFENWLTDLTGISFDGSASKVRSRTNLRASKAMPENLIGNKG